jgi:hypothetical protein
MSAVPVVTAGGGTSWRCRACGQANVQAVRVVAASASVPCSKCGAFNNISTASAPAAGAVPVSGSSSSHVPVVSSPQPLSLEDKDIISRFQTFLRFQTVAHQGHINGANEQAVAFLKQIGEQMGLKSQVLSYAAHRPLLVLTLPGTDASLSSLLLNSHYDVVPVMRTEWKVDPFAADVNADGEILARGTQDMKSVCMQYLEALLRLVRGSQRVVAFRRTVHLSFMPDEETGGEWGMQKWVDSEEFKALNVGFALDEGIANPNDEFTVFYGQRTPHQRSHLFVQLYLSLRLFSFACYCYCRRARCMVDDREGSGSYRPRFSLHQEPSHQQADARRASFSGVSGSAGEQAAACTGGHTFGVQSRAEQETGAWRWFVQSE